MLHFELQRASDKLIREVFAVKKDEVVVITADTGSEMELVHAVASSVYAAGAKPMVITIVAPDGVGKAADAGIPVDCLTGALLHCDVWIEFNHQWLLYSTPFERAIDGNKKMRYMCLVDFDCALLTRVVGNVETPQLQKFMTAVADIHKNAHQVHVTTPAGTDISFLIDPEHVMSNDCGDASQPGMHFLTGQLNVIPQFDTICGKIVFDGTITPPFGKVPDAPVTLYVDQGRIQRIEGGRAADEYQQWLASFDDEYMFHMAHIAYGFNPGAVLSGNICEDERVWGCTEWGIGYVSPTEAPPMGIPAKSHTDGICLNSSVWVDDRQILDCGKVCDPELVALSPVK